MFCLPGFVESPYPPLQRGNWLVPRRWDNCFFFRLALDLNMVSVFAAASCIPICKGKPTSHKLRSLHGFAPASLRASPFAKGGRGDSKTRFAPHPVGLGGKGRFEDPLCAIPFAKGNYQPQVYWSLHGFAPASLCASPFAKGGRGDSADPNSPDQIKTSFPPFGGNCSIIP